MHPSVIYTPCSTYSREQTGDITTFEKFEEGNMLTKNCNDEENGDYPDED